MAELPAIVGLNGVNEAFSPRVYCPVIFVPGCNMRCPYCLNTDVVLGQPDRSLGYGAAKTWTLEEVKKYLVEQRETSIVISGGEPCLHENLGDLVDNLREFGVAVGLSTNGTFPDRLDDLIRNHGITMVAMDIKCGLENWEGLGVLYGSPGRKFDPPDHPVIREEARKIKESIQYLNGLVGDPDFAVEFRTTLYPPAVSDSDINAIGALLHKKSYWVLQQFRARTGLLGGDAIADVKPYDEAALERLLALAHQHVENVQMRWP